MIIIYRLCGRRVCIRMWILICVRVYVRVCKHMYVRACGRMRARVRACEGAHVYVCVSVCMCVRVCVALYKEMRDSVNTNILTYSDKQKVENPGIDPGTSHMLSERSTI